MLAGYASSGRIFVPPSLMMIDGVGRILGMGDILTLVEKAETAIKEEEAEKIRRKMMENKFDYDDFLSQFQMISSMGPMGQVMKMLPGMSSLTDKQMYAAEKKFSVRLFLSTAPFSRHRPSVFCLLESPLDPLQTARLTIFQVKPDAGPLQLLLLRPSPWRPENSQAPRFPCMAHCASIGLCARAMAAIPSIPGRSLD